MARSDKAISPQIYARAAGAVYVLVIVLGAFSEGFVNQALIVPGDAAQTARHILDRAQLWQLALASDLIIPVLAAFGVWVSYVLLSPVSRTLILLDVFLNLVSLAVEAVSKMFLLLVLPILSEAAYGRGFGPAQIEALAHLALRSHDIMFNIALIFFGCSCLIEGYLIFISGFLPKAIGALIALAGICYLVACFATLFAPALADFLTPGILLPILVGESAYALWLLVKGVNVARWEERVREAEPGLARAM
jgi:hypothetical protein